MTPEWYHFIGIVGAGMSGLARIMLARGEKVSGCDLVDSPVVRALREAGAEVFVGHSPAHLREGVDVVVVSAAVPEDNVELCAARERGLTVLTRGELLARLMAGYKGIAVAGSHGKTTTTSMISLVLASCGLDPTCVIGGEVRDIGGNARLGKGEYFVAETDESDGSFLLLVPYIAVVTNIDNDHLDYYREVGKIEEAFSRFLARLQPGGFAVLCTDDPRVRRLAAEARRPVVTYGLGGEAEYTAQITELAGFSSFSRVFRRGECLGELKLAVPGAHNVQNALAAVAVAEKLGLPFPEVAAALASFRGVRRRFQLVSDAGGVLIVDDYAHHPTEIATLLQAARALPRERLLVVFQPHRYTRTLLLREEFGGAFRGADLVVVVPLYPAGERPIPGVSAELIAAEVARKGQRVISLGGLAEAVEFLVREVRPGDLVLTVGAGDVWRVGEDLARLLGGGRGGA